MNRTLLVPMAPMVMYMVKMKYPKRRIPFGEHQSHGAISPQAVGDHPAESHSEPEEAIPAEGCCSKSIVVLVVHYAGYKLSRRSQK